MFPSEVFDVGDVLRVGDEILNVTSANGPTATVFRAQANRPAAAHAAGSAIYAYSDAMKENLIGDTQKESIARKIYSATNQLSQAIGSYPTTFIPMPVLFEANGNLFKTTYAAATANVVNGLLSSDNTYCYLEPGCDAFSNYIASVIQTSQQITGAWVGLHCQVGEAHCATTARRSLDLSTPWWIKQEQWE